MLSQQVKTGKNDINKQSDVIFWPNCRQYGSVLYTFNCKNFLALSSYFVYLNFILTSVALMKQATKLSFDSKLKTSKNDSNTFRKAFSETNKIAKNCKPAQHTSISRCCQNFRKRNPRFASPVFTGFFGARTSGTVYYQDSKLLVPIPPIDLHLFFENLILKNQGGRT